MTSNHSNTPNSSLKRFLAGLALGIAAPALAFASTLEWGTDHKFFETEFGDETVETSYPFTNASESTVTIVESSASCGCTVPTLDKKVYAPGESGEVNAIFTIGSRQGKQHKVITIVTEDANGTTETYELKLEVDIPIPVTFKPRVRFWKLSEEPVTQEIEISFNEKAPMVLSELARKDDDEASHFDYEIVTVTEGLQYIVKLTPKKPDQKSRDTFLLVSKQDEKGILKRFPIYAYVR